MKGFGFAIDRGGTFTDVCVFRPDGSLRVLKILSEDPANYSDAPTEAIRRVLSEETGKTIEKGQPIPTEDIAWIRMGTTVATNALLERKGERIAFVVTKGFKDLLFIGNQSRPKIFDLDIKLPDVLYEEVIELDERVVSFDSSCQMGELGRVTTASNGQKIIVEREVDRDLLRDQLKCVWSKGIRSLAVVCMHSFVFPEHELVVREIAKEIGFENVSLSHEVMPMIKIVPRGFTVSADAYLTPKILDYLRGFASGFEEGIKNKSVHFMQSDGGLCDVKRFSGSKAILSGPAGGVVGVASTAYDGSSPVIGFDMGGTSTDVCRYSGRLEHTMETTTAGVTIQAPQLDIQTVAAGGGSRLSFRNGLFVVGPESSGAHPGPVCYKKGGYLAVTDANLVLGRIIPEHFPKIFGPGADEGLDRDATFKAMQEMTDEINEYLRNKSSTKHTQYTVEEVALGFIDVANEAMSRPVRSLTQARGFDTASHVMSSFGGAGGQHACAIARNLGIGIVRIHKYCSLLSAYGIALADVVSEAQVPMGVTLQKENVALIAERFTQLSSKAKEDVSAQGFQTERVRCEYYLHLRFERTDCAIMILGQFDPEIPNLSGFEETFLKTYQREFGFVLEGRKIIVDDVRVRGIGMTHVQQGGRIKEATDPLGAVPKETRSVYFKGGHRDTQVYLLGDLLANHRVKGPALIIDATSTIVVEPHCEATVTAEGNVEIKVERQASNQEDTTVDPIRLAIFSNRFMSIAEQMGRILQRTAISTNIKERLDFSCALFCPDGGLIANAPHIPVHLGGMQFSVRFQIDHRGKDGIRPGDVFLSNHPMAGGSHLPDLTVITPVFFEDQANPVFFLANRAHHADIGGLAPGSMPSNAIHLEQEGATFVSFKLVEGGVFQEKAVTEALMEPGKIAGCSGTRNLSDNISDLKAQIAANNKGISLVCNLIKEYGLDVVQAYMGHIQNTAEESVRDMLKQVASKTRKVMGTTVLHSVDYMDDGTPIELTITIDEQKGEAIFDFSGTGFELMSSCNAPKAVTMSSIIYCLRCLVGKDIPLNSGCLSPIQIIIPDGTILSPSPTAAVVGGNVLTSQRLCDVIFKAFSTVAGSQGCMNNVTFGDNQMGYYETIAGGAGAGPSFDGRSGIHTHMTNTRITDPEILESRYPVILREFSIRENSGGIGRFRGGNGVVRKLQFRRPLSLCLLTERRSFSPYGLQRGKPGAKGLNLLTRNSRTVNLGGKITMDIQPADVLEIRTPGGGGFGEE